MVESSSAACARILRESGERRTAAGRAGRRQKLLQDFTHFLDTSFLLPALCVLHPGEVVWHACVSVALLVSHLQCGLNTAAGLCGPLPPRVGFLRAAY